MTESKRRVVDLETEAEIIRRYLSGQNITRIAVDLGLNTGNVTYSLIRNGVPRRTRAESNRRHSLNENAFDPLSPAGSYWIGLMMADGNVNATKKGKQVRLSLSGDDGLHVATFRDFLGSSHPLRFYKPERGLGGANSQLATQLSISNNKLAADLFRYGVVPNKTETAKVIGLEDDPDFWRGVIDGDGSVGYRTNPYGVYALLELCGSIPLTHQFASYVKSISDFRGRPHRKGKVCNVTLTGRIALPVIRALYAAGGPALPRKASTARHLLTTCDGEGKLPPS